MDLAMRVYGLIYLGVAGAILSLLAMPMTSIRAKESGQPNGAATARPLPSLSLFAVLAQQQPQPHHAPPPSRASTLPLPDGDGKDLTKKLCSTCHGTDVFVKQRHDLEKWNQIIDNMTAKGMRASDDDLDKVADYLTTYLGPDSEPKNPPDQNVPKPGSPQN